MRGGSAARSIPSRSSPPGPRPRLCRCGSPAVGAVLALSVRVGQARPWPAAALCRQRSALCWALPPSVAALTPAPRGPGPGPVRSLSAPPDQGPAVAARPGRPCPALRRLRPASPPRSAAVCLASCALLSVPGTPRRWPGPSTGARPSLSRLRSWTARLKIPPPPSNSRQAKPGTVATGPARQRLPRTCARQSVSRLHGRRLRKREALRAIRPFFSGPILG